MSTSPEGCLICTMETADSSSVVFRDSLWAAEIGPGMEVPGWFVLRTRRHAELVTGLDDAEADALGRRLRALVGAVAEVTGAPATYQLVFGEDNRHFHTLITARGEHVSADRRRGNILKLLDDGHRDLAASQAMVPKVRAAYERIAGSPQVTELTTSVDGRTVGAVLHRAPQPDPAAPLLVALHGGTYTSEYFCIAGSEAGSFVDIANRDGFSVLRIDRPGYGSSEPLAEAENTFTRQAEVLDAAIAVLLDRSGADSALLVGHSIGGMIAMEIAARQPPWPLVGLALSGMGARIPAGGAAEQLGALPLTGIVDLPVEEREKLWYGPSSGVSPAAISAARSSFAPAPMVELTAAPQWAAHRLDTVAAAIRVPIHHTLAEFDSLWDPTESARESFLAKFSPTVAVHSEIMPGVGHCIDHHISGVALHHRHLAFARDCMRQGAANPI